jgi:hypothetical protein
VTEIQHAFLWSPRHNASQRHFSKHLRTVNLIIHTGCMVSSREQFKISRGSELSRFGIWIRLLHYAPADIYEHEWLNYLGTADCVDEKQSSVHHGLGIRTELLATNLVRFHHPFQPTALPRRRVKACLWRVWPPLILSIYELYMMSYTGKVVLHSYSFRMWRCTFQPWKSRASRFPSSHGRMTGIWNEEFTTSDCSLDVSNAMIARCLHNHRLQT